MKKINIVFIAFLSVFFMACGAVEEKRSEKDTDSQVSENTNSDKEGTVAENTVKEVLENAGTETTDDTIIYEDSTENKTEIVKAEGEEKNDNSKGSETVMSENEDGTVSAVPNSELKNTGKKKKAHVKKFYVIAGSFKEVDNAHKSRKFYRVKGFKAIVLYKYKGWYRVATGAYANRELAEKAIAKVRAKQANDVKGKKVAYWLLWR